MNDLHSCRTQHCRIMGGPDRPNPLMSMFEPLIASYGEDAADPFWKVTVTDPSMPQSADELFEILKEYLVSVTLPLIPPGPEPEIEKGGASPLKPYISPPLLWGPASALYISPPPLRGRVGWGGNNPLFHANRIFRERTIHFFKAGNRLLLSRYGAEIREMAAERQRFLDKRAEGLCRLNRFWADGFHFHVNDAQLTALAATDRNGDFPCKIFMVTHECAPYDIAVVKGFLAALYEKYGQQTTSQDGFENIPGVQFLINKTFTDCLPEPLHSLYTEMEAVAVETDFLRTPEEARRQNAAQRQNAENMARALSQLQDNKAHWVIFPEGLYALFPDMPMSQRFQPGIARYLIQALQKRPCIPVIPLGIAYDEKRHFGTIHIGEEIRFRMTQGMLHVRTGGFAPDHPLAREISFYAQLAAGAGEFIPISTPERVSALAGVFQYLPFKVMASMASHILASYLMIARDESARILQQSLPNPFPGGKA